MSNQYRYKLSICFKFLISVISTNLFSQFQFGTIYLNTLFSLKSQILIIPMSGENIDYNVIHKEQYKLTQGKIDSIYQKNSNGFQVEVEGNFTFEIRLKSKSIVNTIEVKPSYGENLTFELVGEKDHVHEKVIHQIKKQFSPALIQFPLSKERKLQTSRIKISISNNTPKLLTYVGLVYLLVKGEKVVEEKQNKSISKKAEKKSDFFDNATYSPHKVPVSVRSKEAAIFQDRKKNKTSAEKIEIQLKQMDEEYQLKRAIQLSKKQQQKEIKKDKVQQREKEDTMSYYSKPRQYTKIDFEKNKKVFQFVTSKWVQAQRKIQGLKDVKQSERLSNAITVRHFYNKTICIDVTPKSKKLELTKLCEEMGAIIKSEPCENCLVISSRTDTQCVAKARKMKYVKILKPEFVTDCKQCEAYLQQKDYFHKL